MLSFKDHSEARNSAELLFTKALIGSYAVGIYPQNMIHCFFKDTPVFRAPNLFFQRSFFSSDHVLHNPRFLCLSDRVGLISATHFAYVIIDQVKESGVYSTWYKNDFEFLFIADSYKKMFMNNFNGG